jgi:hypothetical protein
MGTWISHLRIAENLLQSLPELDEAAFAFGNLAPDSGLPNEDWTQFDPQKEVTHFLSPGEDEGRIRDLEFYRLHLAECAEMDLAKHSFLLGYFFHLLCDNLWSKRLVSASKQAYATLIAEQGIAAWHHLKRDWYGLDQRYVRDHQDCIFWRVIMNRPNPPAYLPYLSEQALHQQMDYIRDFYGNPDPRWELDRAYPYLNEATMSRFVADSTRALLKIHAASGSLTAVDSNTALSLLTDDEVTPYKLPIGDRLARTPFHVLIRPISTAGQKPGWIGQAACQPPGAPAGPG